MTGKIQTGHTIRRESLMMAYNFFFYRFKTDYCVGTSVSILNRYIGNNILTLIPFVTNHNIHILQ